MNTPKPIKEGLTIVHMNAPELSRVTEKMHNSRRIGGREMSRLGFAVLGVMLGLMVVGVTLLDSRSTRQDNITTKSLKLVDDVNQPAVTTNLQEQKPAEETTSQASETTAQIQGNISQAAGLSSPASDLGNLTKTYTYKVVYQSDNKTDQNVFKTIAKETLNDARGWPVAKLKFDEVSGAESDFELILAEPEFLPAYSESCSVEYSCRVGKQVIINAKYWRESRPGLKVSLLTYRQMVINHEVGHWLGLDHVECPGEGQTAPVMMQQSIALKGCVANAWPLASEIELLSVIPN